MSDRWEETTLGTCYNLVSERADARGLTSTTTYLGMEHLNAGVPVVRSGGTAVEVTGQVCGFKAGDTLFGRLRPYLRKISFADCYGYCSPEILVLRPIPDRSEPRFLHALASSDEVVKSAVERSAGSRMPRTSANDLAAIPVSLPPLDVQRRIVDVLGALDAHLANLKTEREAAVTTRDLLRQSLSQEFSPVPLATMAAPNGIQIGPFGSQLHASEYQEVGVPVIMPRDIVEGEVSTEKINRVSEATAVNLGKHRVQTGDIIFARRGDLGKRALITREQDGWLCGTGCLRFRSEVADSAPLLFEALANDSATEWLTENAVGTTMLNLNTQILAKLPVVALNPQSRSTAELSRAFGTTIGSLTNEEASAVKFRGALLQSLLSREVEIPASYDDVLERALEAVS